MTESSDDDLGVQPLGGVFGIAGTDNSDDDETLAEDPIETNPQQVSKTNRSIKAANGGDNGKQTESKTSLQAGNQATTRNW